VQTRWATSPSTVSSPRRTSAATSCARSCFTGSYRSVGRGRPARQARARGLPTSRA
jgi:hypothetical protein